MNAPQPRWNFPALDPEIYGPVDADILEPRFVTWHSANSSKEIAWCARINIGGRDFLPVAFFGSTEEDALSRAKIAWLQDREQREAKVMARREAARKTADKKAVKA